MTIDEYKAALQAMTPEEWFVQGTPNDHRINARGVGPVAVASPVRFDRAERIANARGIVALRNHAAELLERLGRARLMLARLRDCKCKKEGCVYRDAAALLASLSTPLGGAER